VNAGDPREGDMWTALFYCCSPPPAAGFFSSKLHRRQQIFSFFSLLPFASGSRIFLLLLHLPAGSSAVKYQLLINK
jgi:hypothetical protein